jgi:xylulokinase
VEPFEVLCENPAKKIREEFDLPSDVKITAGAHDSECCSLGANLSKTNDLAITLGSYEEPMFITEKFEPTLKKFKSNIYIEEHIIKNKYLNYSLFYSGVLIEWLKNLFFSGTEENSEIDFSQIYANLGKGISETLVIPYLKGSGAPELDESKKGAITGLTINTDKYEIIKSFIESSNFCIKKVIDSFYLDKIENILAIGGGANSEYILQNKADILNREIKLLDITESGAYGACMIAYYTDNIQYDIGEIMKIFKNNVKKIFYPQEELVELYERKYFLFLELLKNCSI